MSTAGITFGGLASGLDTKAIIAALMAVERRPVAALEAKKAAIGKQKDLFGDFRGLLTRLQDAARALKDSTGFLAMQATSDDESLLTVAAGSTATPGSWQIVVHGLASAQVSASQGHADRDVTDYGAATLQITDASGDHLVAVGSGTGFPATLDGIAQAIDAAGLDVAADVVDTGQAGGSRYQLVLRGRATGAANAFSLTLAAGGAAMQGLVDEIDANQLTAAADAHIAMNGVDVWRPGNSITDVIPGVTLDLKSADPSHPVHVTVATDAAATADKVQEFVDAYDALVDFFETQNQLGENGAAKSPLFGDVTLRSIRSGLRAIVGGVLSTGNPAYSLLSQAGITADRAGRLTLDQSKFEAALAAGAPSVAAMFTSAGTGVAARVFDQLDSYTDPVDGLLEARNDGFDRLLKETQQRIDQANSRLDRYEQQLEQRFANLETLLAQLQGQGSALSSFPTTTNTGR